MPKKSKLDNGITCKRHVHQIIKQNCDSETEVKNTVLEESVTDNLAEEEELEKEQHVVETYGKRRRNKL